jgi:hypothetical protein
VITQELWSKYALLIQAPEYQDESFMELVRQVVGRWTRADEKRYLALYAEVAKAHEECGPDFVSDPVFVAGYLRHGREWALRLHAKLYVEDWVPAPERAAASVPTNLEDEIP